MSAHTSQKYYLLNLSTRTISVSTHLRSDNYTLKSGKCIYLGSLTDELILKYHKYSALNVSLRIVTKDKLKSILNKSINLNNDQIEALLNDSEYRVEHPAGSISDTTFFNVPNYTSSIPASNTSKQLTNLFTRVTPSTSCSVQSVHQSNDKAKEQPKQENKEIDVKPTEEAKNVVKKETETSSNNVVNVNDNDEVFNKLNSYTINEQAVEVEQDDSINTNVTELKEEEHKEELIGSYNLETAVPEFTVNEIDVVEESIKQDVKDMSYDQLYTLAKERNLLAGKKGRPSRDKLIKLLSNDTK